MATIHLITEEKAILVLIALAACGHGVPKLSLARDIALQLEIAGWIFQPQKKED